MKHCFEYFRNTDCEYFPCHKTEDPQHFNCLFCFCPLYQDENCGGNFTLTPKGIKDCSACLIPHKSYDYIINKLK